MSDAVTTILTKLADGKGQDGYEGKLHLTNISDGTGESAVKKLNISDYFSSRGITTAAFDILEIRWSIYGFTAVELLWDHDTDVTAFVMAEGSGYENFRDGNEDNDGLRDPSGADGDPLITTYGAINEATYDITITFRIRKLT